MRDLLRAIAEHKKHCTASVCCLDDLHEQLFLQEMRKEEDERA